MILTVTLNAALDLTYRVGSVMERAAHRVEEPHARAGGKGVNVSRVLGHFGRETLATGLLGGSTGAEIARELDSAGIIHRFAPIAAESRRTVTVVASGSGDATVFNEAGPLVTESEWLAFLEIFDGLLDSANALVCAGSMPAGVPVDAYAQLVRRAAARSLPVIIDAHGPALLAALVAGPSLIKPNLSELRSTTGLEDPLAGCRALRDLGGDAVVASLGPGGMIALTADGSWLARPTGRLAGNPTGAGDASVAAFAAGFVDLTPWPDRLRDAVAWSAAAVLSPYAGDVDPHTASRLRADIELEEIHAAHQNR